LVRDLALEPQLLETDLALVYVSLQRRRERAGEPGVYLIRGEMRFGRTAHK
jgi:hypothetical protein